MRLLKLILVAMFAVTAAEAKDSYVTAGAMIDVVSGERTENVALIISDGKIAAVGKASDIEMPDGATHVDLGDLTILPGLMDMHVHLAGDATRPFFASMSNSVARQAVIAVRNAERTLMAGFTTVRDVGDDGYVAIAVRDGIDGGDVIGPRIWSVGNALGVTGGHCDNNFMPPEMNVTAGGIADGPWAARAKVRENIKYGANAIKFCATGGVFSKGTKVGQQQYTLEEMKAIVDEAHLRGVTVAAHAHGTEGIKDAIRAGVDSVEHVSFLDDEGVALALEHGTYFSLDIYNTEFTLTYGAENGVPEENINKERMVSVKQRASFTKATKAGVNMVFGSDAAIYPHGDNGKQFSRMTRFGMTPLQAIQAATVNSAALLKQSDSLGQIKEGFFADIIAVDGNPLENISLLEDVKFVMKNGVVYKE